MGGFLYWSQGRPIDGAIEQLRRRGFGHAFENNPTVSQCTSSPDGSAAEAICFADPARVLPGRIKLDRNLQTWLEMPGGVWVGYWNDDKPTPGDLARTQQIDGHYVPTDAGEWLVPLARQFQPIDGGGHTYATKLTETVRRGPDGGWISGGVVPSHDHLWKMAGALWDAHTSEPSSGGGFEVDFGPDGPETIYDAAGEILAANYLVRSDELAALGALTTTTASAICLALIDWPTVVDYLKKNATTLAPES